MIKCVTILLTCIFLQLPSNLARRGSNDCSISFPKKDDRHEPIILASNNFTYNLIIPERGVLSLRKGESISLFCPSKQNKLKQSGKNLTVATCVGEETLRVSNNNHKFNSLQCERDAKGSVVVTNVKCGNNRGRKIKIGLAVENDWITLIQVCYDNNAGNALYAEHTMYGQGIKFASRQKHRPTFGGDGIVKGFKPNISYQQKSQKMTFSRVLGSDQLAEQYLNKNSYLARGHLAPDADFLYAGFQYTTYFYINTCPQWQVINAGNWLGIERMVRKVADNFRMPLKIITGSHGVLALPDLNNNLREIYLDDSGKLPVPKFLWKIVYDENYKEAIAFVALNNPFIQKLEHGDLLCTDICVFYGWNSKHWSNMNKGFVYCCDVKVLQKSVPTIPKLEITGILRA